MTFIEENNLKAIIEMLDKVAARLKEHEQTANLKEAVSYINIAQDFIADELVGD